MLYSIGKDSSVMLHLALKAFYPAQAAVPAAARRHDLEVPRDDRVPRRAWPRELGLDLLVHINPDGVARGINPFDHGSAVHTDVMKTEGAEAGARQVRLRRRLRRRAPRRGEVARQGAHLLVPLARSTAGTRRTSGRSCGASTTRASTRARSIRVFPLSNWTELDIWQYIHLENIPIVPLYFAAERPVVERDGTLIMVDDDRMPLEPGETPQMRSRCASARSAAIR